MSFTEDGSPWYTYCTMVMTTIRSLRKHWPLIGIAILVLVVGLHLFRAPKQPSEGSSALASTTEKGVRLEDVHYSQDDPDARVKWFLDARDATISHDMQVISFRKFRLKLEPENRPRVELVGEKGTFHRDSGEIHLQGGLIGSTADGYRIVTESAVYSQKKGCLETSDPVKLSGPFFTLEGRGLLLNVEKETLLIPSDVTALIDKGLPVL